MNYKPFVSTGLAGTMDHVSCLRGAMPGEAIARWVPFQHGFRHIFCLRLPPRRVAAGLLACAFLLAGCVASLHHNHDLQSSTPCPICYALHLPARIGAAVHIPQLALLAFVPPVVVQIARTEPSPKACPPRAPPV